MLLFGCAEKQESSKAKTDCNSTYFDHSNSDDQITGGIKMISTTTPKETFNVWAKRGCNNQKMKNLLLHGAPVEKTLQHLLPLPLEKNLSREIWISSKFSKTTRFG